MKTIKIGVCDDREEDRHQIVQEIKKAVKQQTKNVECIIRDFSDGLCLVNCNLVEAFELVFLDIEMPDCNGFEVARRLGAGQFHPELVFVSKHENMVFDSQKYRPLWFVRKRRLSDDVKRALTKYLKFMYEEEPTFRVRTRLVCWEIRVSDIAYMECSGHEITIVMKDKTKCRTYGSLKAIEEELPIGWFLRIHNNFLINQHYVVEIGKEVMLQGEVKLPIAKDRRKEVREALLSFERKKHGIQS